MHEKQNSDISQRNNMSLIIALFIIINVFLGTIGILWYNTNLRIHEIGIKRALGSTGAGIRRLLIAENMFLAIRTYNCDNDSTPGANNINGRWRRTTGSSAEISMD